MLPCDADLNLWLDQSYTAFIFNYAISIIIIYGITFLFVSFADEAIMYFAHNCSAHAVIREISYLLQSKYRCMTIQLARRGCIAVPGTVITTGLHSRTR